MTAVARALPERIAHGLRWRWEGLRNRVRDAIPHFTPVLLELHTATGRGVVELAGDLLTAWSRHGCDPVTLAEILLWDSPKERWHDFFVGPELDRMMERTTDAADRALARDKAALAAADRAAGLPWLPTLAVVNRREGAVIDGVRVIDREHDLWPALDELRLQGDLALKPSAGRRGIGFFRVSKAGKIQDGDGRSVTPAACARAVFDYGYKRTRFGYVVQPALQVAPEVAELTGVDVLTTVRIVTALSGGEPHVVESFLKIPSPDRLTDNFRDGTTGTLVAGFDPTTGVLTDLVGLLRPGNRYVLERTASHPVTGRRIAGAQLPFTREILEVAFRAALAHPRTATFGWDIALSASGLFLLDANLDWGPGWQPCSTVGVRPILARLFPGDFRPSLA